jgi:hypothetical protein
MQQKGYTHVNTSGQDNGSSIVFIAVAVIGAARDALWRTRREIACLRRKDDTHGQ